MTRELVGVLDQGSAGSTFVIFDNHGRIVVTAHTKHEQVKPGSGWVEYDPLKLWQNARLVAADAMERADLEGNDLAAIGITNQRETAVLWDKKTGNPVYNAISWKDRRTIDRIRQLKGTPVERRVNKRTGLELDTMFSASKAAWILDNVGSSSSNRTKGQSLRDRANAGDIAFGTIDSWLVYKLTGKHVTDVTNASRTMIFDIHDLKWDHKLLKEFTIPPDILPTVVPSGDAKAYGSTDFGGLFETPVPVTGVLADQQASLLGQFCVQEGDTKITYGTGSFLQMNVGNDPPSSENGLLSTIAYQLPDEPAKYALEGAIFTTGEALQWLRDIGIIESFSEATDFANATPNPNGVYFVPAMNGLGSPYWNQNARATMVGISRETRSKHIARATIESIAYHVRDVAETISSGSNLELDRLHVDSGIAQNNFFCQIQSDVLNVPVIRPAAKVTSALGAAVAAGLAVDVWDSLDDAQIHWNTDTEFHPTADRGSLERRYRNWLIAIECTQLWSQEALSE